MWRLMLVVGVVGLGLAACGEGLNVEEDYMKRIEAHQEATFAVTYDWELDRPTRGLLTGTINWYQDGRNERVDYVDDSWDNDFVVISTKDRSYECSETPNRISQQPGCFVDIGAASSTIHYSPLSSHWHAIHAPERYEVTRIDGREIAGQEVHCFDGVAKARNPDVTLCLTEDGLLLYADVDQVGRTWTATDVAREVPEGIFEPPMGVTGQSDICEFRGGC